MQKLTLRLHPDTILNIERAAKKAGVVPSVMMRKTLQQIYDGTPHNPLGVVARPKFYSELCHAIGVMFIVGENLDDLDKRIAKKKGEEVRRELEIDYEH